MISIKKNGKYYFRKGVEEIQDTLLIKNTIPNVSSVVFKNIDMKKTEKQLEKFKIAGDWFSMFLFLQREIFTSIHPLKLS